MRRTHGAIAAAIATLIAIASLMAVATPAAAQSPRFEDAVGYELQQALRGSDIGLNPGSLGFGGKAVFPTFYSDEFNRVEEVRCERTAIFGLIARANDSGNVLVAVCEREADRVRALARDAKRGLEVVIRELKKAGMQFNGDLAKAGWTYEHINAPDGEEHHFPVLMIGHGILGPQTMVFVPRGDRRVVVVQGDVHRHCENYGYGSTALCANTRAVLAQLGRRVLARVGR